MGLRTASASSSYNGGGGLTRESISGSSWLDMRIQFQREGVYHGVLHACGLCALFRRGQWGLYAVHSLAPRQRGCLQCSTTREAALTDVHLGRRRRAAELDTSLQSFVRSTTRRGFWLASSYVVGTSWSSATYAARTAPPPLRRRGCAAAAPEEDDGAVAGSQDPTGRPLEAPGTVELLGGTDPSSSSVAAFNCTPAFYLLPGRLVATRIDIHNQVTLTAATPSTRWTLP